MGSDQLDLALSGAEAPRGVSEQAPLEQFAPARATEVFDTYWRFAAERQAIFFRRLRRSEWPLTHDPILARFRFTNAYRASDRVSQYLIRRVMYQGDQTPSELFFRVILFKLFNKIETWQLLDQTFGGVRYESFSVDRYDRILSDALRCGDRIYSAAYIMPPVRGKSARRKHTGHLSLIDQMMRDELPWRITEARTLQAAFEMLRSYPSIGDFLAYQYAIDLNYSALIDFSEMEFVVPGPGARRGIRKCFSDLGGLNESDLIRLVAESQAVEFNRRGLHFEDLWGRPLQLVDCQNLFCEVDKYARVAHPNVRFKGDRSRIKQAYRRRVDPIEFWYPPKWSLNDAATAAQASLSSIEPV